MKKLIIMGISHHGNLGDVAIGLAEEQLIEKHFGEYKIYHMPEMYLDICAKKAKKFINDEDIILLQGGGNIGDIYGSPEKERREVIKLFPNNKIIIFPQTAYFSDTEKGKEELEISKKIYNEHKNLIILAREEKTYEFMKKHFFNNKIYFAPDVVMTMHIKSEEKREGALLILRTDKEKVLEDKNIEKIKEIVKNKFGKFKESDMHLGSGIVNIGGAKREKELKNKFKQFQTSQIAITDRLHGMIFAAITETPCVVFGNFNYKISGSYEWLKNLEYIQFCNNIEEIEEAIEKVTKAKNRKYDNKFAEDAIVEILKKEI